MIDRSLYDWFLASAQRHGDSMALEVGSHALTYDQLLKASERMAALIERQLGRRPERVGLLASRSLTTYVGYLAIQRLGAAVVPLNPRSPVARNLAITKDSGLEITVADETASEQLDEYAQKAGVDVVDMTGDDRKKLVTQGGDDELVAAISRPSSDYAYIVFTSGSTGRPKGVPTTHRNISSFLEDAIPRFHFAHGCRVSQTFEVSFDGSIIEIFGAWGSGATLCIPQHSDVFAPVRFVNEKRLTHWLSVPSIISFAKRLRALAPNSMPTLQYCNFGGEPLTAEQADAWLTAAPNATIHNCYGPTELTVIITGNPVPRDKEARTPTSNRTIPIGEIYPHMEWVLLDEELRSTDDGELCVRGPQRCPGYLDPAHNVGRFVDFDGVQGRSYDGSEPLHDKHWYCTGDRVRIEHGELVHLGRIDDQVKIHGYRTELGEIESVLRKHPDIAEIVVVAVTAADEQIDLHAFYTGDEVSAKDFARLAEELPVYMRPRSYHHRQSIPLSMVGKVDRKLLAAELTG
ncbi:amino acid adenylation domain-containing protein [Streptomyces sp. NPDC004788]